MADQKKVQIPLELVDQFGAALKEFTREFTAAMKKAGQGLDTTGKKADKQKAKFTSFFSSLKKGAKSAASAVGVVVAAMAVMANRAAEIEPVAAGFENLTRSIGTTADVMLKDLSTATGGVLSKFELMKKANNAIILGVAESSEQFSELAGQAIKLGRAVGLDARTAIDSLVTGIGRQSRLMLDNLGIIVKAEDAYAAYARQLGKTSDKLTENEKKAAFTKAAMAGIGEAVAKLGDQDLPADSWLTSLARLQNAFDEIVQSDTFRDALIQMADVVDELIKLVDPLFEIITKLSKIALPAFSEAAKVLTPILHGLVSVLGGIVDGVTAFFNALLNIDEVAHNYAIAMGDMQKGVENLTKAQRENIKVTLEQQIAALTLQRRELIRLSDEWARTTSEIIILGLKARSGAESFGDLNRKIKTLKGDIEKMEDSLKTLTTAEKDALKVTKEDNKETDERIKKYKKIPGLIRERFVLLMGIMPVEIERLKRFIAHNEALKRILPKEKTLNEYLKERAKIPVRRDFKITDLPGLDIGEKLRKEAILAGLKSGEAFMTAFEQSLHSIGDIGKAAAIGFGSLFTVELKKVLVKNLSTDFWNSTLGKFVNIGLPIIGQLISSQISKIGSMIVNAFRGPTNEQLIADAGKEMAQKWGAAWSTEVQNIFDRVAKSLASTTKTGKANVLMAGFSPEVLKEVLKNVTSFALDVQNKFATSIGHGINMWKNKLGLTLKQAFQEFVPVLEASVATALKFGEVLSPQIINLITHARNLGVEFQGLRKIFDDALSELLSGSIISVNRLELLRNTAIQVGIDISDTFTNIFKGFLLDVDKAAQEIIGIGLAAQQAGFQINNSIITALGEMFPKTEAANAGILRMLQIAKELGATVDNKVKQSFLAAFRQIIKDGKLTTQELLEIARAAQEAGINLQNSFGRAIRDARSELQALRGQLRDMNMSIVDSFIGGIELRKRHQEQWHSWIQGKQEEIMAQWREDNKELLAGLSEEQRKQLEIREGEKARAIALQRMNELRDIAKEALKDGKISQDEMNKLTKNLNEEEKLIVGNLVKQKLERQEHRKELREQAKEQRKIERSIKLQRDLVMELRKAQRQSAKGGLLGDASESAKVKNDIHKAQQDWQWMVNHPLPNVRVRGNVPAQHGFDGIVSGPSSGFALPITAHGTERVSIQPLNKTTNVNSGGNVQLSIDKIVVPEGTSREQVDHLVDELHSRIGSGTTPFRIEPRTGAIKLN